MNQTENRKGNDHADNHARSRPPHWAWRERFTMFLTGLVLAGVLAGTLLFLFISRSGDTSTLTRLKIAGDGFLAARLDQSFARILFATLATNTGYLAVLFALGFWAIAQPAALGLLLFRGLGLGATVAQIYAQFGRRGILIAAVLVVPNALLSVFALVLGARESVRMSNLYASVSLRHRTAEGIHDAAKLYAVKFLVLEAFMAASALCDCICAVLYNRFS
ncbi:MAG: hypothetical protein QM689_11765 [Oscillospiraceae bacterium]